MKAILLNRILTGLAFLGVFIAGVLSLEAGLNLEVPCGPSHGCAKVAADPSSHFFGIPVAYIGLVAYIVLAGLAIVRALNPVETWKRSAQLGYLASAIGTFISLYLQYTAFVKIQATCLWCFSSAVTMVITLIVYALLAQDLENLPEQTSPMEDINEAMANAAPSPKRREFLYVGIIAALVAVGLVVMGMSLKEGGAPPGKPPAVATLATLVPEGAHVLGTSDNAPLTIVEFADLGCPACQKVSPKVKAFVADHPGKVRLCYRHYPIVSLHKDSMTAAAIAECAADQNRFWEYIAAVMSLGRQANDVNELLEIATSAGCDATKIKERLANTNDPAYGRLDRDMQEVKALGINSTPTFFTIIGSKVEEVLGPSQIMDALSQEKYQKVLK